MGGSNINRPLSVATSLWAQLGCDLERCCGGVWRPFSTLSRTLPSSQLFGIKMSERAVQITVAQCVVMKFLINENVGPNEIWRRLCAQYGESTLLKTQVKFWHKAFRGGWDAVQNTSHQRCPRTSITPKNIAAVRDLIECDIAAVRDLIEGDSRLTVVEICQELGRRISYGSVRSIIKKRAAALKNFGPMGTQVSPFEACCCFTTMPDPILQPWPKENWLRFTGLP
jgi:hypothetical protein